MHETPEKRRVLLGITGSIAAYKAVELARILISRGYEVRAVMTASAQKFVTAETLRAITGRAVVSDFWESSEIENIEHIEVADWADVYVIAPATADALAKLALGISDTPLLAIALATRAPIVVAPAMNVNMLEHPATAENMTILQKRGATLVEPEEGALACGWNGSGRLAEPWQIFYHVRRALSAGDFVGKRIVVTTGPTREAIDPVRFVSNRSSGKMGAALAREAFCRGADVTVIHGPVKLDVPAAVQTHAIVTAAELKDALFKELNSDQPPDVVIMAAAVADFKPRRTAEQKLKKQGMPNSIELEPNDDILAAVGDWREKRRAPVLVGFAVETGDLEVLLAEVRSKLERKRVDVMVGNFASEAFDLDTNRVWIVDRHGHEEEVSTSFKGRVANKVLNAIKKL